MVQKTSTPEPVEAEQPKQDNLVNMAGNNKEKQVLEINKQMSSLESSINKLNRQLNTTNKQIKTDVERLTSSDAEISEKVSETYKQLGVFEKSFKDLNDQSSQIHKDLKAVNATIRSLEKESKQSLDDAIEAQSAVNADFRQNHETLIGKAEDLSDKAGKIAKKLDKSIKENSKALTELESRIVQELEVVSQSSQQRDSELDDKISQQKAKMLVMQGVDEALEKRANSLEATTKELLKDSRRLKDATNTLDILTSKLSTDVEDLENHTRQLQEQNEQQQAQIDGLNERTDSLGRTLLALANLEKKHFRLLGGISLLLLLALLGAFFYGEYMRDTENVVEAQRNEVVEHRISDLQNRVEDEQMASQVFYQEISNLEQTIDKVKGEMEQATGEIEAKLQEMNDQVETMDGRIQYIAPLYNFGSNNTIHGSQWLANLNPEHLSIKIATVADKQDLYDIAQRYNNHFTEELAYFMTADNQYTLIYGGQYANDQQLESIMRRMPRYINGQRIEPVANADILAQITR